jgi:hypothetical protein
MKSPIIPVALLGLLAVPAHAGLLARYTFDNSADLLEDSSGNGNTATAMGTTIDPVTTYPSDTIGTASTTVFNNAGNTTTSLGIPNSTVASAATTYSVAGWIKTTDTNGYFFGQRNANTFDRLIITPASFNGVVYNGTAWASGTKTWANRQADFLDGQWHHFACTVDGTSVTIYRDGVVYDTMTLAAVGSGLKPMSATNRQRFGMDGDGNSTSELEGRYDDLRVYNHTLTAGEVGAIFNGSDSDVDGLPDGWELGFPAVTSLTDLDGTLTGPGPGAGTGDFDGDGLSDLAEYNTETDPTDVDTDNDNISDGNELAGKNASGVVHGFGSTNPKQSDSDSDTIRDDYELEAKNAAGVAHSFGPTNPNSEDSDNDGMGDLYELTNNLNGGLNPNSDDSAGNLDGDASNWTNLDEYLGNNTNGVQTRADTLDTDGDGLQDIVENNSGTWTDATATGSNPTDQDTDNDGLNDNLETPDLTYTAGATPTNSNPNIADTDADGLPDSNEVTANTNPADPDTDADTYNDIVELLNDSVPTMGSSIPASTVILAGTDFEGILPWLNTGGGVSADASSPLLPGAANNGLPNNNSNGTGALLSFAKPAAVAYYSIDVRYTGTLNGQGFNVTTGNDLNAQTGPYNQCALRFQTNGSFGYSNGTTFTAAAPAGTHLPDRTYTVQFVHDIPNNTYSIAVYDRSDNDNVIFEIIDAPTRNTTPAATLYFGSGVQQDSTNAFVLRMDNLVVSTEAIPLGSAPTNDFAAWTDANGAAGQSATDDHDSDGVDNGVEYFMGQTGSGFTAMPTLDSSNKISWPKNPDYLGTFAVQTSLDLVNWPTVTHTVNGNLIEYTLPSGQGKVFVRLAVDPQ